jgi:eukaryotic-like serine/threonine-protein kinase
MTAPQDILQKYLQPGMLLSRRYTLERLIGVGAYGVVWSAIDQTTLERVAVKALPPASENSSRTALGRFQREMKIISSVAHPNIITIHDYGQTDNGVPYMVLEFLDGVTLDTAVRDRPMATEQGLRVSRQLLGALQIAHDKGVIHRDLKPANIMLVRDKGELVVKILDFGMAKMLSQLDDEAIVQLTREGVAVGTPRYIAPEQARGLAVGPYTDLYAVGLLIYETFTGQRAVKADTIELAVMAHVSPEPLNLPEIDTFPERLRPILYKLLAKDIRNRYQSAAEVLRDLDALEGRQAPMLTARSAAIAQQEPLLPGGEKLELALPRPVTGSMAAISATRPLEAINQPPRAELRRQAGSFGKKHGHIIEFLFVPPLAVWSFMLLCVHFNKLDSVLRGLPWIFPAIGLILINALLVPGWRQPVVRVFNVWCLIALLAAHLLGIRALSTGLLYQPAWFLNSLTPMPGATTLIRFLEGLAGAYGRMLGAL